jgi:hypothetical protein
MSTLDDFGYAQCNRCHGEFLRWSLNDDGLCYWCAGVLTKEGTR